MRATRRLPSGLRTETPDNVRRDVGRGVGPCDQAFVLVDHEEQALLFRHSRECGSQLHEERILRLPPHPEEFRLRILDESTDVYLKSVDLALALLSSRGREHRPAALQDVLQRFQPLVPGIEFLRAFGLKRGESGLGVSPLG